MPIRLLLVLLVLVGQVPFRICTCTAASHQHPDPARFAPDRHPSAATHSYEHHSDDPGADDQRQPTAVAAEHDRTEGDCHQPTCPAADPRPILTSAPLPQVETAEAFIVPALELFLGTAAPPATAQLGPTRHPPGRPVPLFISLLVLRI